MFENIKRMFTGEYYKIGIYGINDTERIVLCWFIDTYKLQLVYLDGRTIMLHTEHENYSKLTFYKNVYTVFWYFIWSFIKKNMFQILGTMLTILALY